MPGLPKTHTNAGKTCFLYSETFPWNRFLKHKVVAMLRVGRLNAGEGN